MAGKFISYLRVSTDKQGQSGLGIEASMLGWSLFAGAGTLRGKDSRRGGVS